MQNRWSRDSFVLPEESPPSFVSYVETGVADALSREGGVCLRGFFSLCGRNPEL